MVGKALALSIVSLKYLIRMPSAAPGPEEELLQSIGYEDDIKNVKRLPTIGRFIDNNSDSLFNASLFEKIHSVVGQLKENVALFTYCSYLKKLFCAQSWDVIDYNGTPYLKYSDINVIYLLLFSIIVVKPNTIFENNIYSNYKQRAVTIVFKSNDPNTFFHVLVKMQSFTFTIMLVSALLLFTIIGVQADEEPAAGGATTKKSGADGLSTFTIMQFLTVVIPSMLLLAVTGGRS
ncbi:hypothetical protein NQ317_012946 [Molorchus minor]|uniref:Uncharacterized protein n=1 Tax=Molorchus minor TaxID=1323400 RepID=A0ABQ9JNQ2_9CUCU|nr:hypothetical protein NQ317_012946 [Molorchus minor]